MKLVTAEYYSSFKCIVVEPGDSYSEFLLQFKALMGKENPHVPDSVIVRFPGGEQLYKRLDEYTREFFDSQMPAS
jgi:hypothetical protein